MLAVLTVLTVLAVLAVRRRGDAGCLATRRRDGGGGVGEADPRTAARLYACYTTAMPCLLWLYVQRSLWRTAARLYARAIRK